MRKRILIAEAGDTVRQAAETILRKNGFEVISVAGADKAREVLNFARPDLILVGGSLQTSDQHLFFERLQHEPKTADLPILVIEPSDKKTLDWPGELMVRLPIDPHELLDKINTHVAQKAARVQPVLKEKDEEPQPLQHVDVSDTFLDEALGLEKLDVTDSEVLDGTTRIPRSPKSSKDVTIGYEHPEEEDMSDSAKVESLIIRDDTGEIRSRPASPQPPANASGTGALEIMKDQYGMSDPSAFKQTEQSLDADHDYNWFVNSMREETTKPQQAKPLSESSRLNVTKTSAALDPITPGPGGAAPSSKRTEGVEKFIDEFKKEIEQLRSSDTEPLPSGLQRGATSGAGKNLAWEDKLETVTAEQVGVFTRELARELGDRIAERLVAKIDPDKLLQMLKEEIIARARKK